MRKLLFIISFLLAFNAYSQGGPKVDAIKFQDNVTTVVRDGIDVPTGETYLIYNIFTNEFQYANDDDVWKLLSPGAGDVVLKDEYNTITGLTSIGDVAEDTQVFVNENTQTSGILGGQTGIYVSANSMLTTGYSNTDIDNAGVNSLINKNYLDAKTIRPDVTNELTADFVIRNFEANGGLGNNRLAIDFDGGNQELDLSGGNDAVGGAATVRISALGVNLIGQTDDKITGVTSAMTKGYADTNYAPIGAVSVHDDSGEDFIALGIVDEAELAAATIGAGDLLVCTTCTPAELTDSDATISLGPLSFSDDRTKDEATIVFSDIDFGDVVKIWFNRASEPSYSGATMKQRPGTLAFPSATECVGVYEVNIDNEIDYYFYTVTP